MRSNEEAAWVFVLGGFGTEVLWSYLKTVSFSLLSSIMWIKGLPLSTVGKIKQQIYAKCAPG